MLRSIYVQIILLSWFSITVTAFVVQKPWGQTRHVQTTRQLDMFGKMFEESGPLGKGITVGKVQVALNCPERGPSSIYGLLASESRAMSDDPYDLATFCRDVCLALLRKKDDWTAACSQSQWFSEKDAGKAESLYNEWTNREAAKFEKEYVPESESDKGGPTVLVVSIIVEIQGDETKFDGAGFSFSGTVDVLNALASDCMVEEGECLNAVEVFWTPSESDEVLTKQDLLMDFPELIDL